MTLCKVSVKSRLGLTSRVEIAGGAFLMGSDDHYPEEGPTHVVEVAPFLIEETPVTNGQFRAFVRDTGYRTVAERPLEEANFPELSDEERSPGALVFFPTQGPVDLREFGRWWKWTPGACWKRPEGPNSSIKGREDHPVVHVAFEDAQAYAHWCGREMPSEAQWEYAARGGLEGMAYCWGREAAPGRARMAKFYEGAFPWHNSASDGHPRTAPVGTYPPNNFGLFDMAGNVWEWTNDWYAARHDSERACCTSPAGRAAKIEGSYDPAQPQVRIPRRVLKGGSFLCADEYCHRYRPAARRPQMVDTGMSHIGFRCVQPCQ